MLRFLWQDGRLDFSAVLRPTERLSSHSKNFVGGAVSSDGRVDISIAKGVHPSPEELSYLIWRELDNGRNQDYVEDVERLVANSDYSKFTTYSDNVYYHATSGDYLPQIANSGLQPGRGQNWKHLPVGRAVYLWPNAAHAWSYRDVLENRSGLKNPIMLRIENLDRLRLGPDHEEFAEWIANHENEDEDLDSTFAAVVEASPTLRKLDAWPYGLEGNRLALQILAELPPDLKAHIAELFSDSFSHPLMYDGPINADQISVAKTRELTEALYEELEEKFQQQTQTDPEHDEYYDQLNQWIDKQGDWINIEDFQHLLDEPYYDTYDESAGAFDFVPLRQEYPDPSMQLNLLTGSQRFSYTGELEKWVYVEGLGGEKWSDIEFSHSQQENFYRDPDSWNGEDAKDYTDEITGHIQKLYQMRGKYYQSFMDAPGIQQTKKDFNKLPFAFGLYDPDTNEVSVDINTGIDITEINAELFDGQGKFFDKQGESVDDLRDKFGADVEDTEPANNFGFMKEPHEELYPCAFRGGRKIPLDVKNALKDHVLKAIEEEYKSPDDWIYFTIYGSGISYNWDEEGDFDIQMWVDYTQFQDGDTPVTQDDLLADVRRLVQSVNFPSFADLGLETDDCEGKMLIQYYPKPGMGTKDENLASKPYACYDLEQDDWLYFPKPLTPEFYGEAFILLLPKAQDIAVQSEAALDELARNVTDWQFWQGMYSKYKEDIYLKEAEEARDKAEQFRENVKNLFEGVFQGRAKAYSPEGKGIQDERDLLQKLLEVWGIFQKLKHNARAALPWEENEIPDSPVDDKKDGDESSDAKDSDKNSHWRKIAQLYGLPQGSFGPNPHIQDLARSYMDQTGQDYNPPATYATVDRDRAERIAQEYEGASHRPNDPDVAASYRAMANETLNQYHHLVNNGYSFEFEPEGTSPYASPHDALHDLADNKHLYVYPTDAGFGSLNEQDDHPLLQDSGVRWNGQPVTHNDIFRAVHDVFGHAKEGVGFRANGEENAWRQHSAMYSDLARPAMTAETRGQNSWVNFGPYGEQNRNADQASTIYADQKATVLPDWVMNEGANDPQPEPIVSQLDDKLINTSNKFTINSAIKTADWEDVQEKAQRYYQNGNVTIHSNDPTHVVATVYGDVPRKEFGGETGVYQTEIWKDDPNSNAITRWTCSCPWGEVSWGRTRQWKKFEGRPCAHATAVQWASQTSAQQMPQEQLTIPGMEPQGIPEVSPSVVRQPGVNLQQFGPTGQPVPTPGGPNPGIPQPPPVPAPPPPVVPPIQTPPPPQRPPSHLTQPGEQMSLLDMPGTFSHIISASFRSGDMVRTRQPIYGQDNLGNPYIVPKGMEGEVIWSDDEETIAIFSIEINGPLEPFNVRVESETDSFYRDESARPFKKR